MQGKFVAYYRVSTERQGRSGLGLDAQKAAVLDFLDGGRWTLLGEFVEVESGKVHENRPKLQEAVTRCRKDKATLIIAKLDRLSRNAGFLLTLRDSGIEVKACDMPHAGTLEFGIRAVIAQHEREEISRRTKAALAAAKARGVELGKHGREVLSVRNRKAAIDRADELTPLLKQLRQKGMTIREITETLNQSGVPTVRGGRWHIQTVHRLMQRAKAM